jgi:hypothetical protein
MVVDNLAIIGAMNREGAKSAKKKRDDLFFHLPVLHPGR